MASSHSDIDFDLVKTLGEGAFGKVYLVTDKLNPTNQYAMKVINLSKSPEEERELALKEARLLSDFKHDNILRYVESFEEAGALCIVTEFCDGGDLSQYLEGRKGKALQENRIVEWFREISSALSYLHGRKIIHRDMKTQNVFLTGTRKIAKLGDLGLAKVLERPNAKAVTFCGSPYYMSPELFACKPYDSKSDIWALGVCVYEMATLERPFDAMLMQQLVFKIVHGQLPTMPSGNYSPELITVMEKMLQKDSDDRPSADDLLNDPVFKNHTPPQTPPTPSAKPVRKMNWLEESLAHRNDADEGKGAFNMESLVSTLTETHKQRKQKLGKSIIASSQVDNKIMASTYAEKSFDKTCKDLSSFRKDKTLKSDIQLSSVTSEDMEETLAAVAKGQPNPAKMLQLVVRTLTQIFPKGTGDEDNDEGALAFMGDDSNQLDPETMLLGQIAQLQRHCVRMMGGDLNMFRKAYDMLSHTDDDMKLEEKLIKFLSPQVFGMCGVQLFYCKNFEYNLQKLRDGGRGTTEA
ncbi:serine/threonine-protein kinase Nek6-like [Pecten maximus]|uniref:serine/threonine-protein kinase Nek6-like n=1 Tax=Pecten maximus TaxID=6579 RepID=UPI0014589D9B|nr:serine/threonine-protein kinase Nek6-like [Pecten maximus]XP_033744358.1 serine/threonine-protein kinase Nek6-like [Pecten maximus]